MTMRRTVQAGRAKLATIRARRTLLTLSAAALLAAAVPTHAADPCPSRPVRILVGVSAGGPTDAVVRALAQRLSTALGQPVLVDNRPGAGSMVANEHAARAPKDGHTLLFVGSSLTMGASFTKVRDDPVADFAPISQVLQLASFLVVRADMKLHTLAELVAYLKAHSGRAAMAADLICGRLQAAFDGYTTAAPHIRSGTLTPLAVVMSTRSSALPDVPTIGGEPASSSPDADGELVRRETVKWATLAQQLGALSPSTSTS